MKVISIGDLVCDYYYKDGKLLGINGGMTSHNIIANLAKTGLSTAVYGVCGNDNQGRISIKSLSDLKVDVSNIVVIDNIRTRCFHVSYFDEDGKLSFISKKRCPYCNNKSWYEESLINTGDIFKIVDKNDILVFDNLNDKNQKIIDKSKNRKIIDIGQYFEFENIDNDQIIKKIKGKFEIINFNERVSNYLLKRLDLKNDVELYKKLKPIFMTITRGNKGATFIYNDEEYNYSLVKEGKIVDSTGAGDAFISSIIKDAIKCNFNYDVNEFSKWYQNSNKLTYKVVNKMGARGHLKGLYKIKKINNKCTCDDFEYKERKQIKRCNININNLETRIVNAINLTASNKIDDINFSEKDNCIFIGTGGSFAGACFASKVVNELFGSNTYCLYPRDVLYRNNKNVSKVVLFSYSGTTNDIINSVTDFDKKNVYMLTKGEIQKIVLKTGLLKKNIISYRTSSNKGKERGFLSFEGVVSPASMFFKYYINNKKININPSEFVHNSISYWNNYFDNILTKEYVNSLKNHGLINIFEGDYTESAAHDLESKIIESGIINCIVHEKKNFSHGRFINYENQKNQYSVYFKQKSTSAYESELLNYIKGKTIIIESRYDGILAEFDLLLASQYFIYKIGKLLDIDVSKPSYSDNALKIYFYNGKL